jgi:hypothetical protein
LFLGEFKNKLKKVLYIKTKILSLVKEKSIKKLEIMNTIVGYPFVNHVDQSLRPIIENPKEFLKTAYVRFYTNNDNLIHYGYYKLMGYKYDFTPYLKKYLYKQYNNWYECYAPNKTLLRQVIGGRIDKIIESV